MQRGLGVVTLSLRPSGRDCSPINSNRIYLDPDELAASLGLPLLDCHLVAISLQYIYKSGMHFAVAPLDCVLQTIRE